MNASRDPENQQRYIGTNSATIELIRMELLLELNGGETRVLSSVINIPRSRDWVERQQIRRRLVLLDERNVVYTTLTLTKRLTKRDAVLSRNVQKLLKVQLIDCSRSRPQLRTGDHSSTWKTRD